MDHISYHGTHRNNAKAMVGPPSKIRLDRGKGELGQGFYTGTSPGLAISWANERYKGDAKLIELTISLRDFTKLTPHVLKTRKQVTELWKRLKKDGTLDSHKSGCDYIMAPFA